jgi:sulfhydrogenase subunit delta
MLKSLPKVAFFDFTGCEGCQLTVIDSLQDHPDLLDVVEIVQFRDAMSERRDDYQIAFIEGACSRPEDEARLQSIREQAQIVVALGACAHLGGVNAIRNWQAQDDVRRYVYGQMGKLYPSYLAQPIDAVIQIDGFIPGCPIDPVELIRVVKLLIQNRPAFIPDYPVCIECKLLENKCVFLDDKICLGSVTRAGCNAKCPSYGLGCYGCRGMISTANLNGLKIALNEHGFDVTMLEDKIKLFQSYQRIKSENKSDGND